MVVPKTVSRPVCSAIMPSSALVPSPLLTLGGAFMTISERTHGDVVILDIAGRITEECVNQLRDAVRPVVARGCVHVVFNLSGVPYVDSAALGEIVRAYTTTTRRGGTLKLLHVGSRVRQLLTITRLSTVLEIFDDERDAVRSCVAAST